MSNYLNNQLKTFGGAVKSSSSTFVSQKRRVDHPAGSSTTAATPNDAPPKKKRPPISTAANTIEAPAPKQNIVYSQPAETGSLNNLMTQVHYALSRLKETEQALTAEEIAGHLKINLTSGWTTILQKNERVHYDPKSRTYAFIPLHNIRSDQALLDYLRGRTTAHGIKVAELMEGWAGAKEAITRLEKEREILVTRTKKDNQPRYVFLNDKSLDVTVEDEFKNIWNKIPIPEPAELPRLLQEAGLKPTSVDPATIKKAGGVGGGVRKKPKQRKQGRITNTHMSHIIKDFSAGRK